MKAVWIIALNYVREQRWIMLLFVSWMFILPAIIIIADRHARPEDFEQVFQQECVIGVMYGLLTAVAAIHTDRKSKRILGLLSKGIYRFEYLAGLLLGNMIIVAAYAVAIGTAFLLAMAKMGIHHAPIWGALAAVWLAASLTSAMALMFAAFLHPSLASLASSALLALPWVFQARSGSGVLQFIAADHVIYSLMHYRLAQGWNGGWNFAVIAVLETGLCLWVAAMAFEKRDVTVTVE